MKKYIIVGSNNFWYDTFYAANELKAMEYAEDVIKDIIRGKYEDNNADEVFLYEVHGEPVTLKVEETA